MSELKTVEHKGKIYQIGMAYEFSVKGEVWHSDVLIGVDNNAIKSIFETPTHWYKCCREIETVGTITKAPVKLVTGAAYKFEFGCCRGVGYYVPATDSFSSLNNQTPVDSCTNIIPLVPAT